MTKETLELLDGVKLLAVSGKKIAKDGIKAEDFAELVNLISHFDTLATAFKGVDQVPEELKNLKQEDVVLIIAKVYEIAKAVKEA